jgi:hypothetical protein
MKLTYIEKSEDGIVDRQYFVAAISDGQFVRPASDEITLLAEAQEKYEAFLSIGAKPEVAALLSGGTTDKDKAKRIKDSHMQLKKDREARIVEFKVMQAQMAADDDAQAKAKQPANKKQAKK